MNPPKKGDIIEIGGIAREVICAYRNHDQAVTRCKRERDGKREFGVTCRRGWSIVHTPHIPDPFCGIGR